MLRRRKKGGYIFTNKNYPNKGIMSTILGVISICSIVLAVYLTFRLNGEAVLRYGASLFLTTIFSMIGLGIGVASRMEKDKYYLFSYIGIVTNFLAIVAISFILYAGAYGL